METEDKLTEKKEQDSCIMNEKDNKGNTNICCCYVIDSVGRYEDPCFYPADKCC
jgi:hypothetical protein